MSVKSKGILGSVVNLFGYAILAVLLILSSTSIANSYGGAEAMINETVTNTTFRDNFILHHVAYDMITPLYPVDIGPYHFNITLDDGGILIMLLISFFVTMLMFAVIKIFRDISWLWLVPLFLISFMVVGFLWQNIWLSVYFETGYHLGQTNEELVTTLEDTKDITSNFFLLMMSLFTIVFLLFKGKGLFHT